MRRRISELKSRSGPLVGSVDGMLIHTLPEPLPRKGPFGVSAAMHLLLLAVLVAGSWSRRPPPAVKPDLAVVFNEPREAAHVPVAPLKVPPPVPASPPAKPPAVPPRPERGTPVEPPKVPKEIPPPIPLPPPKRMGEQVPIPHLPVPGTVPPEAGKTGAPGPPALKPPDTPEKKPGTPDGANETDLGAGGPGSAGTPAAGPAIGPGRSVVTGGATGKIEVPPPGGGRGNPDGAGGGGRRRGLDLSVPPDSGAFGEFSFDDKDYDWSDYRSQMYWAIWRAWMNRLYVSIPVFERWSFRSGVTALKGSVLIRFVIERSGTVSTIDVLEPSTMQPLDESARDALKEVILPRLPDDFTKDREGVTGRFIMEISDLSEWKEYMKYMKYKGVF